MSRKNVQAAYAAYDAFRREDWASFMSYYHEDAELREEEGFLPDPGTFRGRAEIEKYFRGYYKFFDDRRDGKMTQLQHFPTMEEALQAVGVEE